MHDEIPLETLSTSSASTVQFGPELLERAMNDEQT
jgi:hypothetical protein